MSLSFPVIFLPVVAAVIGYFTNWLAIKMLFRPLEEKRLFGIRIPFTPGVIPRRRAEISTNIGQAVADNLLTSDAVAERIDSEEVRAKIDLIVYNWLRDLLDRQWDSFREMVPEELASEWGTLRGHLQDRVSQWLIDYLNSEEAEELLDDLLSEYFSDLKEKQVNELVADEVQDSAASILDGALQNLASNEEFQNSVTSFWRRRLEGLFEREGCLDDYISPDLKEFAYEKVEDSLPLVLIQVSEKLDDPGVRKQIKMILFDLVDKLLEREFKDDSVWDQFKRGMLETFVISVEDMKRRIEQAVDEGVPKLVELLEREEIRDQINESVIEYVDSWLQKDLSEFDLSDSRKSSIAENLSTATVGLVRNDELRKSILTNLSEGLAPLNQTTLDDLMPPEADHDVEAIRAGLRDQIISKLRSESTSKVIREEVESWFDKLETRPVGPLRSYLREEWIDRIHEFTVNKVVHVAKRETPKILGTLDVAKLVESEVDQFSLEDVENLVLDVTGNQLRAITWFGALIGFLIGLVQLALLSLGG